MRAIPRPRDALLDDIADLKRAVAVQQRAAQPTAGWLPQSVSWSAAGDVQAVVGGVRWRAPFAGSVIAVQVMLKIAPGSSESVVVDVNKNGTTIFTTQANRPTCSTGDTDITSDTPDIVDFVAGDEFSVDVDVATGGTTISVQLDVQPTG